MSKGMAMSGFRVGYTVATPEIMAGLHATAVNILGATNTAAQAAATAALEDSAYVTDYVVKYERRRLWAAESLGSNPGVRFRPPQAGLMIWVDIAGLATSRQVAEHLLTDARIIV